METMHIHSLSLHHQPRLNSLKVRDLLEPHSLKLVCQCQCFRLHGNIIGMVFLRTAVFPCQKDCGSLGW